MLRNPLSVVISDCPRGGSETCCSNLDAEPQAKGQVQAVGAPPLLGLQEGLWEELRRSRA